MRCVKTKDTVPTQMYAVTIYMFVAMNWYPGLCCIYPVLIVRVGKEIVKANVSFVTCYRQHVADGMSPRGCRENPFLYFPHIPISLKNAHKLCITLRHCAFITSHNICVTIHTECALWTVGAEAEETVDQLGSKILNVDKRDLASNITAKKSYYDNGL